MKQEVRKEPTENQKGDSDGDGPHRQGEHRHRAAGRLALSLGALLEMLLAPVRILKKRSCLQIFDVFVLAPVRTESLLRSLPIASASPG